MDECLTMGQALWEWSACRRVGTGQLNPLKGGFPGRGDTWADCWKISWEKGIRKEGAKKGETTMAKTFGVIASFPWTKHKGGGLWNLQSFHNWSSCVSTWLPAKETCVCLLFSLLWDLVRWQVPIVCPIMCIPRHGNLGKKGKKKTGRNENIAKNGVSRVEYSRGFTWLTMSRDSVAIVAASTAVPGGCLQSLALCCVSYCSFAYSFLDCDHIFVLPW
jgi:hypothetical protein